ncbi:MAG: hypothetical protein H6718_10785 [Polyangiaceae bacterium]|nr:hypothetical protein [Polyangiaceae bacterium]MCB9607198.1 hypothetical protein [Polyangiaceae bacterium]
MSGRPCEICSALASSETDGLGAPTLAAAPEAESKQGGDKTRRVLIEDRLLSLCDEHAAEIQLHRVDSIAELRELFQERYGKRSLVLRRSPLDRRVFPPRPEGRRMADGRRASDR